MTRKIIKYAGSFYEFRLYESKNKERYFLGIITERGHRLAGSISKKDLRDINVILHLKLKKYISKGIGKKKLKPLKLKIEKKEAKKFTVDIMDTIKEVYENVMDSLGYPIVGDIVAGIEGDYIYIREDYEGRPGHSYFFEVLLDKRTGRLKQLYKITDKKKIKPIYLGNKFLGTTDTEKRLVKHLNNEYISLWRWINEE